MRALMLGALILLCGCGDGATGDAKPQLASSENQTVDPALESALFDEQSGKLTLDELRARFGPPILDTDSDDPAPPITAIDFAPLTPEDELPDFERASRVVYWKSLPDVAGQNPVVAGLVFYPDDSVEVFRCSILPPE